MEDVALAGDVIRVDRPAGALNLASERNPRLCTATPLKEHGSPTASAITSRYFSAWTSTAERTKVEIGPHGVQIEGTSGLAPPSESLLEECKDYD